MRLALLMMMWPLVAHAAPKGERPIASTPLAAKVDGKPVAVKSVVASLRMGQPVIELYDAKLTLCAATETVGKEHLFARIVGIPWTKGTTSFGRATSSAATLAFLDAEAHERPCCKDHAWSGRVDILDAPTTGAGKLRLRLDDGDAAGATAAEGQAEVLVCTTPE
ncbi:MAG: hypothetical protein ABI321_19255 [Polyangia bacterium]